LYRTDWANPAADNAINRPIAAANIAKRTLVLINADLRNFVES